MTKAVETGRLGRRLVPPGLRYFACRRSKECAEARSLSSRRHVHRCRDRPGEGEWPRRRWPPWRAAGTPTDRPDNPAFTYSTSSWARSPRIRGLQGERRDFCIPTVGHDRLSHGRFNLSGADYYMPHQPVRPARRSPRLHRCERRLRPDDPRADAPTTASEELVAERHRRVELRGHQPVDPGHPRLARRASASTRSCRPIGAASRSPAGPRARSTRSRSTSQRA